MFTSRKIFCKGASIFASHVISSKWQAPIISLSLSSSQSVWMLTSSSPWLKSVTVSAQALFTWTGQKGGCPSRCLALSAERAHAITVPACRTKGYAGSSRPRSFRMPNYGNGARYAGARGRVKGGTAKVRRSNMPGCWTCRGPWSCGWRSSPNTSWTCTHCHPPCQWGQRKPEPETGGPSNEGSQSDWAWSKPHRTAKPRAKRATPAPLDPAGFAIPT
jgi:hypothetical protein